MNSSPQIKAQFHEKLRPLFEPHRYKVLRGGRASLKSWGIADALLIKGWQQPIRWLCAREFQSSIKESVHQLLEEQIKRLGLSDVYRVEQQGIFGKQHETEFSFTGLSDETSESIKSYEGYDGAWVEEARVLTEGSLNKLLPTIRKEDSEVWFSYNPELETDPIHVFAESLQPHEGVVIDLNWRDNPWFNSTIEGERARAERTLPKIDYQNIWEGRLRPTVAGAIYADEVAELYSEHRVGLFPYDPRLLVYPVFDIGWNDSMAIGMYQRVVSKLVKINYLENDHKTYDWYSQELSKLNYNWGTLFLPHDGATANPQTGMTGEQVLTDLGWEVKVLEKIDPKEGIRQARMTLKNLFVNLPDKHAKQNPEDGSYRGCARWMECMKRYRRSIPKTTREPGAPVHDEYSHGADEFRYATQAAPEMDNNVYDLPPRRRRASWMAA